VPVILARIDDRLIHGQVTEGWFPKFRPEIVLVVSDDVAASEWHRELYLASLPDDLEGMVSGVGDAPGIINELESDPRPSYVLFESPKDACTAVENGAVIKKINVGGMHSSKGKREMCDYIFVDDEDVFHLKRLKEMGVELDFRDLPDHDDIDIMTRLEQET